MLTKKTLITNLELLKQAEEIALQNAEITGNYSLPEKIATFYQSLQFEKETGKYIINSTPLTVATIRELNIEAMQYYVKGYKNAINEKITLFFESKSYPKNAIKKIMREADNNIAKWISAEQKCRKQYHLDFVKKLNPAQEELSFKKESIYRKLFKSTYLKLSELTKDNEFNELLMNEL